MVGRNEVRKAFNAKYSALVSHFPITGRKNGAFLKHLDEDRGIATVELRKKKKEDSLGLTISGGTDKGCPPFISNVRQGGIADQCDYFCVGEDIISINSTDIRERTHSEIIQLVQQAGKTLAIEVQYRLPVQDKENIKTTVVRLQTDGENIGFTVRGGESKDSLLKRPVIIAEVEKDTAVSRLGLVFPGDEIVKINGRSLSGLHICQVKDILSFVQDQYTLEIRYVLTPLEPHVFSDGSLSVDLIKPTDDADPGLTLDVSLDFEEHGSIVMVSDIHPGSIAERVGCICVGDLVLSVNGISFEGLCLEDAVQVLLNASKVLEIKLFPSSLVNREEHIIEPLLGLFDLGRQEKIIHLGGNQVSSNSSSLKRLQTTDATVPKTRFVTQPAVLNVDMASPKDTVSGLNNLDANTRGNAALASKEVLVGSQRLQRKAMQPLKGCRDSPHLAKKNAFNLPSQNGLSHNTITKTTVSPKVSTQDSVSISRSTHNSCKTLNLSPLMKYLPLNCTTSVASVGNLLSQSAIIDKLFSKSDILKIRLEDPENDFGMQLEDVVLIGAANRIIIADVLSRKAAQRTGRIMVGDRIVCVNGIRTDFITSIDVERLLQEIKGYADMELEFNIFDTIVPTSGSFNIKLHKSYIGTGIVLAAPSSNDPERYPRIVEIKKGSTAHRSGVLSPGDQIIHIDDTDICGFTFVEANKLLETESDVVKLTIKKDEEVQGTTFVIELERKGQQLGITISGSENPFEAILITGISEDGLAHKSKAVLVGDRLLAINGESLRGKSLTEAYDLLKNAENRLKLLIKRREKGAENVHGNNSGEPQVWTWMGHEPVHVCVKDSSTISMIHEKDAFQKESDVDSTGSYCAGTDSSQTTESDRESFINMRCEQEASTLAEEVLDCVRRSSRGTKSALRGKASTLPRLQNNTTKQKYPGYGNHTFHRSSDTCMSKYDVSQQFQNPNSFKRSKSYQGNGGTVGISRRFSRKSTGARAIQPYSTMSEEKANVYYGSKKRQNRQQQASFDWSHALSDGSRVKECINYPTSTTKREESGSNVKEPATQIVPYLNDNEDKDTGSESPPLNRSPFHSPRPTRARHRRPDLLSFPTFSQPVNDSCQGQSSDPPSPTSPTSPRFPFFPVTLEQVVLQRTSQSTQTATQTGFYGSSESVSSALLRRRTSWREATESYELELKHKIPSLSIDFVTLKRQNSSEDFGFSVSEKLNGSGIYIRSVQPKSLAAESGKLRRYDRILQVNGIHTRDLNCDQLVPFLQRAGRKLDIVIERRTPAYI